MFDDLLQPPGELAARITLSEQPLETRVADVCPGCGLHMLGPSARLVWLRNGGTIHCQSCRLEKTRPAA